MKKLLPLLLSVLFSISLTAQDSAKVFRHEIGFNTVSLIKQVFSNNPSSTLSQLPYDIFYNFYFNSRAGLRLGLGIESSNDKTSVDGQATPRTTNTFGLDVRFGFSYNFVTQKRLTLNAFADVLRRGNSTKTANTQTTQTFGNPISEIKTTTSDNVAGTGFQIGAGVKYNIYSHLSLYLEVPLTLMASTTTSQVNINDSNSGITNTTTTSKNTSTRIFLPTTIYLVLRF